MASANLSGQGDINLTGQVGGPPPTEPPIVENPTDGSSTSQPQEEISGTCPSGKIVAVYINGVFAGSTLCKNGRFSIVVSLVPGKDVITTRLIDNLGQTGPESAPRHINYFGNSDLSLVMDSPYLATQAGKLLDHKVIVKGGIGPYALLAKYPDGKQDINAMQLAGSSVFKHAYKDGGIYQTDFSVKDSLSREARISVAIIVYGQPPALGPSVTSPTITPFVRSPLQIIWYFYLFAIAVFAIFWLGERYELHKLKLQKRLKKSH